MKNQYEYRAKFPWGLIIQASLVSALLIGLIAAMLRPLVQEVTDRVTFAACESDPKSFECLVMKGEKK